MSIMVYVTRKADPLEDGGPDISEVEWKSAVESDPDLSISAPRDEPGFPKQGKYAVWKSYAGGYPVWFTLLDGNIEVDTPDAPILKKLAAYAQRLSARVVSETGELFDSEGKSRGFEQRGT